MLIEQVEALKLWLTNKLSPICDAEPSALAKYVCALVKKDKPEQDLRDICSDQLDVFLQSNTKPFVDELFEALKSKSYIPAATETKPRSVAVPNRQGNDKEDAQKKKVSEISSTTDDKENKSVSGAATATSATTATVSSKDPLGDLSSKDSRDIARDSKDSRDLHRDSRDQPKDSRDLPRDSRDLPRDSRDLPRDSRDFPRDSRDFSRDSRDFSRDSKDLSRDSRDFPRDSRDPPREVREPRAISKEGRDRDKDRERDGSRDRRDSWRDEKNKDGIRDARDIIRENREKDRGDIRGDTREVREPRDRDFRDRDLRRRRTRSRSFSPRRRDFDDRRRRYDERPLRHSPDRRWGRRRSWSRSPRRNRSPLDRVGRVRSRSPRLRSRSPRYRPFRSRTRSKSRPRSWSRPGSGGRPRTRSPSNTRQPDSRGSTPLQDNDFISSSTNDLPAVSSTVGVQERGDNRLQPPVFGPNGRPRCQNFEEKGFCMLGDVCPYDHGADPVVVEDPSVLPGTSAPAGVPNPAGGFVPPDMRIPPPGHMAVRINTQRPPPPHEPYMPEAPGLLQGPPRHPFMRGPPPDLRLPPPGMMMNRPPPPDFYPPARREIIVNHPPPPMDDGDLLDSLAQDKEPSRIVIPAKRPYSAIDADPNAMNIGPPPPRMAHVNQHHHMFGAAPPQRPPVMASQVQPPAKRGFDYNRLGNRGFRFQGPKQPFRTGNLTLEVRKIPPELNNIAKLNEHFGKFGNLTNINVKFQGDPGAALISFSNNGEATSAYRSPEPVFNNRFIKLFWHNAEKKVNLDGETESPVVTVVEDGREVQIQQTTTTVTGGRVGDGIDHPSLMLPVRPTIPPAHMLQLDNTKAKSGPTSSAAPAAGENSSSTTSEPAEKSVVYTSSVGNLKKTVFNPAASAAATALAAAKSKAGAPFISPTAVKTADYVSRMEAIKRAEEEKKIASVKQLELDQKKQELLAKQIQQQKLLLETLEKKKATMGEDEKKSLLQALRTISDAIDKVKYSTGAKKPATTAFQAPTSAQFKFVSSQDQSRKDLLDLELEVMNKQTKGEDTTALRMKMYELAGKSVPTAPTISPFGRGRGWAGGRNPRGRGRGVAPMVGRTHLDNRPKTVEVKGFDLSELDEIKAHFQRFGEISNTDVVEEVPSAFFTYAARPAAEMAVAQGGRYKKKTLIVRWNQMIPKITRTESVQSSEVDDDLSITLGSLDDEALLRMNSEDKSENPGSAPPTPSLLQDEPSLSSPKIETEEDSRAFEDVSKGEEIKLESTRNLERSLSEDLLATDERHFKASYSEDEDEEDHITVTLSSSASMAPTIYTSRMTYSGSNVEQELVKEENEEEDLSFDNSALDYNEDGSWA